MPNRQSLIHEAARFGDWQLRDVGRELRVGRLIAGMTQAEAGSALGRSVSHVSRVENGLIRGFGMRDLSLHAAVVGLKPWVALFPRVARPLDRAQLALFERLRPRIAGSWQIRLEATVPLAGDLRAADALLTGGGVRCMVELITRLADFQAQVRAAHRKQRDIGAERLIFVIGATATNRRTLNDAGAAVGVAFPLGTKATLRALETGVDPGADGIVLI